MKRTVTYFFSIFFLLQVSLQSYSSNPKDFVYELVNDAIALGYNCKIFSVDSYLCWGTPADLKTFNYWQSCFHKWGHHPYNMKSDFMIDKKNIDFLEKKYSDKKFSDEEHDK